jgi:hypothetical protein
MKSLIKIIFGFILGYSFARYISQPAATSLIISRDNIQSSNNQSALSKPVLKNGNISTRYTANNNQIIENIDQIPFYLLHQQYVQRQDEFQHKYLDQIFTSPKGKEQVEDYEKTIFTHFKSNNLIQNWWQAQAKIEYSFNKSIPAYYFLYLYDSTDPQAVLKNLKNSKLKNICWILNGYFQIESEWHSYSSSDCLKGLKIIDGSIYLLHYAIYNEVISKYISLLLIPFPLQDRSDMRVLSTQDEKWVSGMPIVWKVTTKDYFDNFAEKIISINR